MHVSEQSALWRGVIKPRTLPATHTRSLVQATTLFTMTEISRPAFPWVVLAAVAAAWWSTALPPLTHAQQASSARATPGGRGRVASPDGGNRLFVFGYWDGACNNASTNINTTPPPAWAWCAVWTCGSARVCVLCVVCCVLCVVCCVCVLPCIHVYARTSPRVGVCACARSHVRACVRTNVRAYTSRHLCKCACIHVQRSVRMVGAVLYLCFM